MPFSNSKYWTRSDARGSEAVPGARCFAPQFRAPLRDRFPLSGTGIGHRLPEPAEEVLGKLDAEPPAGVGDGPGTRKIAESGE